MNADGGVNTSITVILKIKRSTPVGMAIDYLQERLFFTVEREHRIFSYDFDGGNAREIITDRGRVPKHLQISDGMLYFTMGKGRCRRGNFHVRDQQYRF